MRFASNLLNYSQKIFSSEAINDRKDLKLIKMICKLRFEKVYNKLKIWEIYVFDWAIPGLFLIIFVLFKHKFKSGILTQIAWVEGEHADHLTTSRPRKCMLGL